MFAGGTVGVPRRQPKKEEVNEVIIGIEINGERSILKKAKPLVYNRPDVFIEMIKKKRPEIVVEAIINKAQSEAELDETISKMLETMSPAEVRDTIDRIMERKRRERRSATTYDKYDKRHEFR
jgi:predicted CopG family antitoxin